jgi:hypothetical protein
LMMIAMLVAGMACLLAGLLAIGFGIPVNEFSFGNTLILAGAVAACAGLIILSIWAAVRELKNIAERVGSSSGRDHRDRAALAAAATLPRALTTGDSGLRLDDRAPKELADVAEDSANPPSASPQEPPSAAKPRRNSTFSSASRRMRERAQTSVAAPSATEPQSMAPGAPPAPESRETPPAGFEDSWPKSERARPADLPLQRRAVRAPPDVNEPPAVRQPPPALPEDQPAVTVLKSGVVDGMAYSLYSDGSIEAQMPEGMMRFASIDELRAHLDQRPE